MYKVMIVDDEAPIRDGLKSMINREHPHFDIVAEASDGIDGLNQAKSLVPDLIITDISMTEMNGLDMIEAISELYPHIHFVILSGYDDFNYAKKAIQLDVIDYLLKPITRSELNNILNKFIKTQESLASTLKMGAQMRESVLMNLITFDSVTPSDRQLLVSQLENLDLLGYDCYTLIQCTSSESLNGFDQNLLFHQNSLNHYGTLHCISYHDAFYLLLCHSKTFRMTDINKFLYNLLDSLSMEGYYFNFIIDGPTNDLMSINSCYKTIINVLDYLKFYKIPKDAIRWTSQYPSVTRKAYSSSKTIINANPFIEKVKNELVQSILSFNNESILQVMQSIFNYTETNRFTRSETLKAINELYQFVTIQMSSNTDYTIRNNLPTIADLQLDEIKSFQKMKRQSISFFCHLQTAYEQHKNNANISYEIRKVKEYIKQHYQDPIYLSDLASYVHLNPNYLSELFKKHTSMNISEYLTDIRIQKAKELLRNTSLNINAIAQHVGYDNPKYFTTVFKKNMGITPKKFKNNPLDF